MGIRFITPETVTLSLTDGDVITIKKRLSHGERDAMYVSMRADNGKHMRAAMVAGYLIGWSVSKPYSLAMSDQERIDTLNNLTDISFDEIQSALNAHIEAQQEKKLPSGEPASSAISTSPGGVSAAMAT